MSSPSTHYTLSSRRLFLCCLCVCTLPAVKHIISIDVPPSFKICATSNMEALRKNMEECCFYNRTSGLSYPKHMELQSIVWLFFFISLVKAEESTIRARKEDHFKRGTLSVDQQLVRARRPKRARRKPFKAQAGLHKSYLFSKILKNNTLRNVWCRMA